MTVVLRAPETDAEWDTYHEIRRLILFERRGKGSTYDPNHPDERRPGHHPRMLWRDDEPIGVLRIDIDGEVATFRLVAIREEHQRKGFGRLMLDKAEEFARIRGCRRVESHAFVGALTFYERCGFSRVEEPRPGAQSVLVTKSLDER